MSKTHYLWDFDNDSYLMEKDGAGSTTAVYTNEPLQYGRLISQRRENATSYFHFDGQQSTRQLTDQNQNVTDEYSCSAFGETVASSTTTENPFRYRGENGAHSESELNQIDIDARPYHPHLGRWINSVWTAIKNGSNGYEYSLDSALQQAARRFLSVDSSRFVVGAASQVRVFSPSMPSRTFGTLQTIQSMSAGVGPVRVRNEAELACPAYGCPPDKCSFELSFDAVIDGNGNVLAGARICFRQFPGEYDPRKPIPHSTCHSEINRSLGPNDHLTIKLRDGTPCNFTEPNFPETRPWPPIPGRYRRECDRIIAADPPQSPNPSNGGCFVTQDDVQEISILMTMEIKCFCSNCYGGSNEDTITLKAMAT